MGCAGSAEHAQNDRTRDEQSCELKLRAQLGDLSSSDTYSSSAQSKEPRSENRAAPKGEEKQIGEENPARVRRSRSSVSFCGTDVAYNPYNPVPVKVFVEHESGIKDIGVSVRRVKGLKAKWPMVSAIKAMGPLDMFNKKNPDHAVQYGSLIIEVIPVVGGRIIDAGVNKDGKEEEEEFDGKTGTLLVVARWSWRASIDSSDLGLVLKRKGTFLTIAGIDPTRGVYHWNKTHRQTYLNVGDFIAAINGVCVDSLRGVEVQSLISEQDRVELSILRPPAGNLQAMGTLMEQGRIIGLGAVDGDKLPLADTNSDVSTSSGAELCIGDVNFENMAVTSS